MVLLAFLLHMLSPDCPAMPHGIVTSTEQGYRITLPAEGHLAATTDIYTIVPAGEVVRTRGEFYRVCISRTTHQVVRLEVPYGD